MNLFYKVALSLLRRTVTSEEELKMITWRALSMQALFNFIFGVWLIGLFQMVRLVLYEEKFHFPFTVLSGSLLLSFFSFEEEINSEVKCENCNHKGIDDDVVYHGQFVICGPHANPSARRRFVKFTVFNYALAVFYFFCRLELVWPYVTYNFCSFLFQLWYRICCSKTAEYTRIYDRQEEQKKLVKLETGEKEEDKSCKTIEDVA